MVSAGGLDAAWSATQTEVVSARGGPGSHAGQGVYGRNTYIA